MEYRQQRAGRPPQGKRKRVFVPKLEAEEASPQYTGHYAGLHPEDTPHVTTADVRSHLPATRPPQEPDDYEAGTRITAMVKRYNGIPMPDGVLVPNGNEQWYLHTSPPPQRAHRTQQAQLPPPMKTDEIPVATKKPVRRARPHWLFFIGIGFLVMVIGWVGMDTLGNWWQNHQNDASYGNPRTFQIDAVVGHNDSPAHPSHFIALNLNRHVIVIEIPGGDISKSVIYSGPVLLGNGQDLTPVTLSFADMNGDGKTDMVLHILDQSIVFTNNGTKFVAPSSLVYGGSNPPTQGG